MQIPNPVITVNELVVSAELEGEAVLLNVETGIYFGLDALGSEIWKMLEQGAKEEEIVVCLLESYEVEEGQLRADIGKFLNLLNEQGLIKVARY